MSWATYEDYIAEVPVILPEVALCIECETNSPEPGCDHCSNCLSMLNGAAWERSLETHYGGATMTQRERIPHDIQTFRSMK